MVTQYPCRPRRMAKSLRNVRARSGLLPDPVGRNVPRCKHRLTRKGAHDMTTNEYTNPRAGQRSAAMCARAAAQERTCPPLRGCRLVLATYDQHHFPDRPVSDIGMAVRTRPLDS